MHRSRLLLAAISIAAIASAAFAQTSTLVPPPASREATGLPSERMQTETYGTASPIKLHIGGLAMVPLDGDGDALPARVAIRAGVG